MMVMMRDPLNVTVASIGRQNQELCHHMYTVAGASTGPHATSYPHPTPLLSKPPEGQDIFSVLKKIVSDTHWRLVFISIISISIRLDYRPLYDLHIYQIRS